MPRPTSSSSSSHARLAQLFLGAGLAAVALWLGLIVWRLAQLPRSDPSAAKPQMVSVRPPATPPHEDAVEEGTRPRQPVTATPGPLAISGEKQERLDTGRKASAINAPPRLPEVLTGDQLVERRLRASEADLRGELRDLPEVRLLSDDEVKSARQEVQDAQKRMLEESQAKMKAFQDGLESYRADLECARADLNAARGNRFAYQSAMLAYKQRLSAYSAYLRSQPVAAAINPRILQERRYNANVRLHQELRRAAAQAGLELASGPSCQLDLSTAGEVAQLSKELRDKGFVTLPGVPFVSFRPGGGVVIDGSGGSVGGVTIDGNRGVFVGGRRIRPPDEPDEKAEERTKAFQAWCDQHQLERLGGTVPTLTQMLQIEGEATRLLLVRELTRINSAAATAGLAVRAVADLSPAVRRAALAGLEGRPSSEYLPVLLRGLRYPWPPVADHAAVALRALKPQEAVASLVDLLDLPSPSAPVLDAESKRYTVREVVRLNHLRNCLLCHAPSAGKGDGLVRGLVPTPGQPLPVQYYESQTGDFVRADITFLRQDFSVNLPDKDAAPWPNEQRFDFVTRRRTVPLDEVAKLPAPSAPYPQRDAVLYALRGLTGKDGGDSSAGWRELLGPIARKPKGGTNNSVLEKIAISAAEAERPRKRVRE